MTDTQTTEAIQKHLDEQPTDWIARLQLADLLEDAGRMDEAKYQRWMVDRRQSPTLVAHGVWIWTYYLTKRKNGGYCYSIDRQKTEQFVMGVLVDLDWPDYDAD